MSHSSSLGHLQNWTYMIPNPPRPCTPKPPRRNVAEIMSRMHKLRAELSQIKKYIDARIHVYNLAQNVGFYCLHCTRRYTKGACGPTCPLLRPKSLAWTSEHLREAAKITKTLQQDVSTYRNLIGEIKARGTGVYISNVWHWERTAFALRQRCEVPTDKLERAAWPVPWNYLHAVHFNKEWSFKQAEGTGPGIEPEIAPEEIVNGKKRGSEFQETDIPSKKTRSR